MPATFSSLPPEVLLEILGHLPRPLLSTESDAPSALVATSVVNKQLGRLSQSLLFERVNLEGHHSVIRWAETEASQFTLELSIKLSLVDFLNGPDWLFDALRRGTGRNEGGKCKVLRVLEIDGLVEGDWVIDWSVMEGLKGLTCLSLDCALPGEDLTPFLPKLANLFLATPHSIRSSQELQLNALTHLTLPAAPSRVLNVRDSFPTLVHLTLLDAETDSPGSYGLNWCLCIRPPRRLRTFSTSTGVAVIFGHGLGRCVTELTFRLNKLEDFRVVVIEMPETSQLGVTVGPWCGRLKVLTLLGMEERDIVPRFGPLGAAIIGDIRSAGCVVKFRESTELEWR